MGTLVLKHLPTVAAKDGNAATAVSFKPNRGLSTGVCILPELYYLPTGSLARQRVI